MNLLNLKNKFQKGCKNEETKSEYNIGKLIPMNFYRIIKNDNTSAVHEAFSKLFSRYQ